MKFALFCKRFYTNKDLIGDRFGRLFHLPKQLGELDHEGIVIAADYLSSRERSILIKNVEFFTLPLRSTFIISNLYNSLKKFKKFRPDVVIASGDIHFGALGLMLARHLRATFVYDIYDDYSAFRFNRNPVTKSIFRGTIRRADLIVCASQPLCARMSTLNSSVTVIENGVDTTMFRPIPRQVARRILALPEDEVMVGFFGSIDQRRGVETLLNAADLLRHEIGDLRVLIAGRNRLGLNFSYPNVDYRGFLPQEEIPILINACDVVVIPYETDAQVDVSNACKIAEYMACGVPVVATRVSNHSEIFQEVPHALCEPGNPADMARAINAQLAFPQCVKFDDALRWKTLGKRLSDEIRNIRRLSSRNAR